MAVNVSGAGDPSTSTEPTHAELLFEYKGPRSPRR